MKALCISSGLVAVAAALGWVLADHQASPSLAPASTHAVAAERLQAPSTRPTEASPHGGATVTQKEADDAPDPSCLENHRLQNPMVQVKCQPGVPSAEVAAQAGHSDEIDLARTFRSDTAASVIRLDPGAALAAVTTLDRCATAEKLRDEEVDECDELREIAPLAELALRREADVGQAESALALARHRLNQLRRHGSRHGDPALDGVEIQQLLERARRQLPEEAQLLARSLSAVLSARSAGS